MNLSLSLIALGTFAKMALGCLMPGLILLALLLVGYTVSRITGGSK